MPAQASQVRACMTQHLLQDAWARGVNRSLAERLAQVAESPLGSQVQSAACSSNKRSRTATLSDEQLVADLEHHYQQCLQAYIDSSTSPDHPPDFEDEAAFSLFQQDTAAHREAGKLAASCSTQCPGRAGGLLSAATLCSRTHVQASQVLRNRNS